MTSSNEQLDCIRNGLIVGDVGHRAAAFTVNDNTGAIRIRNVISQKTTEDIHGWNASVQSVRIDDFVVVSTWNSKFRRTQVFRLTEKGLVPSRRYGGSINSTLIGRLPKPVVDFLQPKGGGPSYLPSGYWRSNYDMIDTLTRQKIHAFLSPYLEGDWLDYTVDEALKSPQQHLITSWSSRHVKLMPTKVTNHMEYWVADQEEETKPHVYNSMIWVFIHDDGKVEMIEPKPTSGNSYVGPSRRITETFNEPPKGIPATVARAIQINLGAYERDEQSFGARWYLYSR